MKRRSLTYVGAFLFALAIFLVWSEMKQPKTKQQPIQTSEVKPKPRLVTAKKTETKPQPVVEEFTIKTRVSMGNSNQQ